jgi:hypothetical protein
LPKVRFFGRFDEVADPCWYSCAMRVALLICACVAVAAFVGWGMDKRWPRSRMRDAILAGAGVYLALTLNSILK